MLIPIVDMLIPIYSRTLEKDTGKGYWKRILEKDTGKGYMK